MLDAIRRLFRRPVIINTHRRRHSDHDAKRRETTRALIEGVPNRERFQAAFRHWEGQ